MVKIRLDEVEFRLNTLIDFSWLKKYGRAFMVNDETGSGCVCIGMQDNNQKYFCKIAGVGTINAEVTPQEAVQNLKSAVELYANIKHPNLIKVHEHYSYNEFYVVVFKWESGECLFDHWNFDKYTNNILLQSPKEKFKALPSSKKLKVVAVIFSFMQTVCKSGYVAVDFYDGSIMYDFEKDTTAICDIDFFKKTPIINTMGENWFGSKRLKAPEEYVLGEIIDETTNVFTLGALLFELFGNFTKDEIKKRYEKNCFFSCSFNEWELNKASYRVALKAVSLCRNDRYKTIEEFWFAWNMAIKQ